MPRNPLLAFAFVSLAFAACAEPGAMAPGPRSAAVLVAAGTPAGTSPSTAGRHPLTVDDMLGMRRISDPTVSPDGKLVAFTVATSDLVTNRMRRDVWIASTDGTTTKQLTSHPENDEGARFSADGRSLYFISRRSGSAQVWRIAVDGGEATQVTQFPVDVDAVQPFPDNKRLLLVMSVYPDSTTLRDIAERDEAHEKAPAKVRAFDALPVRHWDAWDDGKRSHLFVFTPGTHAEPIDLMKGLPDEAPPGPFGGLEEVAIAPSGAEVVFTSKMVGREAAWSTNTDLWVVPADGSAPPRSITSANQAEDGSPVFSPDGSKIAYLAMARPGFESDRRRIVVMDWRTKTPRTITEAWDRSPEDLAWSKDSRTLFATADDLGRRTIFAIDDENGKVTTLFDRGTNASPAAAGGRLVWVHNAMKSPAELYAAEGKSARPITHLNDAAAASIAWGETEQFTFTGAKGDKVYAWIAHPPNVPAGAKVPVAFLVHGGPQGSFGDDFHYRWNPEAFAGHGYAAVMVDFHGSTGYGQGFVDAIRGDWGGAPFEDLMKGLDAALARWPELDKDHMAALGASFGGYMINWINGHTDRFKALVCHDGNMDETMAYYQTDELWFPEWEHGGLPWERPDGYARQSPIQFVKNWKTPTLVIHGARDYRVTDTEGLATFTALQRKGVPSRLLYFPEENHWVQKPLDSKRWHEEVLAWIDKYTRG